MAIAYGTTRAGATAAGTSHSASVTLDVENGKHIAFISCESTTAITNAQLNGVAMTQIDSQVVSTFARATAWRLDSSLASGAYNLTWSTGASIICQYVLVQMTGAATGAAEANTFDTQDNTAATVGDAVSVTATNGAALLAYAYNTSTTPTVTITGDVSGTADYDDNAGAGRVTFSKATLGSSGTKSATFTYSSNSTNKIMLLVSVAAGASAASITSITGSAAGTVRADANCTIAGTGFESSQGSGIVEWQDVGGTWEDAQSYTSWSDTQIVCKAPLHSVGIKIGTGVSFRVTPTTNTADTDTCTFIPATGYTYETLSTTTLPAGSLAYGVTGLAVGDVVIAETSWARSGGGDPATFAFDGVGDGTGTLTGYTADGDFSGDVDIQDATDGALTSNGPQTITIDTTAPTGYTVTIDQDVIDGSNIDAVSFTFAGAEVGATYYYSFSDGETAPVTGNGTISTATDQIAGIDLSTLTNGGVTLSVYLVDTTSNTGDPVEDSATISVGVEGNVETASGLQTALRTALVSALSPAI